MKEEIHSTTVPHSYDAELELIKEWLVKPKFIEDYIKLATTTKQQEKHSHAHNCINSYLLNNGFSWSKNEPTLYIKGDQQGKVLIVCIYVDDIIYIGNMLLSEFKEAMKREFEMTSLGLMKYFLGIEVQHLE